VVLLGSPAGHGLLIIVGLLVLLNVSRTDYDITLTQYRNSIPVCSK
jgi:hypothetical protein